VIDLSYAAAVKLGITQRGTGRVEVRALTGKDQGSVLASTPPAAVKTTIATGIPTRIASAKPTAMDELVGKLPQTAFASAQMPATSPSAATTGPASQSLRYHVDPQPRQIASADNFDAWMRAQGVRVAAGKPLPVEARSAATVAAVQVARATPTASVAATLPTQTVSSGDVQLQVASFASRENADRALARLSAAGIARASLSDVASNGRTLWRLRVQAANQAAAEELAGRIAGLGFGQPQWVRE
jgi:rare lipoprotein A